jgi:hypothetical protein
MIPPRDRLFIPDTFRDLLDLMSYLLIFSPKFDDSIFCRRRNIEVSFYIFNESLKILRPQLGEDLYDRLSGMSDQMKACFQADPERITGETRKGKNLVLEAEELIKARWAEIRPRKKTATRRPSGAKRQCPKP